MVLKGQYGHPICINTKGGIVLGVSTKERQDKDCLGMIVDLVQTTTVFRKPSFSKSGLYFQRQSIYDCTHVQQSLILSTMMPE